MRPVEPTTALPIASWVDDGDSVIDVLDTLALAAFVSGQQPHARTKRLSNLRKDANLLPAGSTVLSGSGTSASTARAAGPDRSPPSPGPTSAATTRRRRPRRSTG